MWFQQRRPPKKHLNEGHDVAERLSGACEGLDADVLVGEEEGNGGTLDRGRWREWGEGCCSG